MRLLFAMMFVAVSASLLEDGSHAWPSYLAISSARAPLPADHSEGFTKGHFKAHEPTDEERVISADVESIAGAVVKNTPHQLESMVNTKTVPVKSAVSDSKTSTEELEKLLNTKNLLDEFYKASGFEQVADLVVSNAKEIEFKAMNNLLISFEMDKLRSLTKAGDKFDNTLRHIFLACREDNEKNANNFVYRLKELDRASKKMEVKWLKEARTPNDVLREFGDLAINLVFWKNLGQWIKYTDAFNIAHYNHRQDVVAATGYTDLDLLQRLIPARYTKPDSPRIWMQNHLFKYWQDKYYPPDQLYTHLGFETDAKPNFDSPYFVVWMKYVGFLDKEIAAELLLIYSRKKLVDMLKGRQTGNYAIIKADLVSHLTTEMEKLAETAAGSAAIKEVAHFLEDLRRRKRPRGK